MAADVETAVWRGRPTGRVRRPRLLLCAAFALLVTTACALQLRAARRSQEAAGRVPEGGDGAAHRLLSTSDSELQAQLSQPFTFNLASAMVLALCMAASVATSSVGIGGGSIYVPTFATLLSWSVKVATAASAAVITAGQTGGVVARLASRHPQHPSRPLVDYRLALMLAGPVNAGAISGVLLNIMLPDWALTFLLLMVMVPLTARTGLTGWRMWRAEQDARRPPAAAAGSGAADGSDAEDDGDGTAVTAEAGNHLGRGDAAIEAAGGQRRLVRSWHGGRQQAAQRVGLLRTLLHAPVALDGVVELALEPQPLRRTLPTIPTGRYRVLRTGSQRTERAVAGRGTPQAAPAAQPDAPPPATHMRRWHTAGGPVRPPLVERRHQQNASFAAASYGGGKDLDGGSCIAVAAIAELPDGSDLEGGSSGDPQVAGCEVPPDDQALPAMEVPWRQVALVLTFWAAFGGLQVARGFTALCSWQWGVLTGASALLCFGLPLTLWMRDYRQRQPSDGSSTGGDSSTSQCVSTPPAVHKHSSSTGSDGAGGEGGSSCGGSAVDAEAGAGADAWSAGKMAIAMAVTFLAGMLGGLVGIGGGMLLVPLFLELGYLPQVATATSGLLVLISSTGALCAYAATGRLNVQYSAIVACACLPCALAGTLLISRLVRRTGRASILVLLLAAAIGLGCAATAAFQGRQAVETLASGEGVGFESMCT